MAKVAAGTGIDIAKDAPSDTLTISVDESDLGLDAVTVGFRLPLDGGGSPIGTGVKAYVSVPFAWTDITAARLLADQNCTAVVDIWKDTLANYPPTDADSITASAPLTLTTADSVEDTTLTGWTTTGAAGDVLAVNVDSNDLAELLTIELDMVRSI